MAKFGRIGWFFGLIFGTLLGILFAPRKGKEFRERIQKERKQGRFGLDPIKEDMKRMGQEIADVAKEIYDSPPVKNLVELGRKKMKDVSGDFVSDVSDFHERKITPLERRVRHDLHTAKQAGKEAFRKTKASTKVVKKAAKEIKTIFQKKKKSS